MHVIWKRPDGFLGALPSDYTVVELGDHSKIWLHKTDKDSYPFKVSGGWEEGDSTKRLNNVINLLPYPKEKWVEYLMTSFSHSMKDSAAEYFDAFYLWLGDLKSHLKGDTWEVEILDQALDCMLDRLQECKEDFLKKTYP